MKIVVLGSGTSHGIPVVACSCRVCASPDSRDKRMRSSVYVEGEAGEKLLIDAGPEFRLQALKAGIDSVDCLLLTHAHADHIHGLDDLRPFTCVKPVPVYGNRQTISEMRERFSYIFTTTQEGGGKPRFLPKIADAPIQIGCLTITPVPAKHGELDILGWEISETAAGEKKPQANGLKSFIYLTDVSKIPPASMALLNNGNSAMRRVVIIGGLRATVHPTHFNFDEAMSAALALKPNAVYLTHICHSHSHEEIDEVCRIFREQYQATHDKTSIAKFENMEIHPAQDGLELTL